MDVTIKWIYRTKSGDALTFYSDTLSVQQAVSMIEDIEKTGRVKELVLIDENNEQWTPKQIRKLNEKIKHEPSHIICYFDGSYDKQAKHAGIGFVIYYQEGDESYRIRQNMKANEIESNNEAEYIAFYHLVCALEEIGVKGKNVTFKGDSLVVLNQLRGEWPCYEESYTYWLDKIEEKLNKLRIRPSYEPIDRKENKEADQLAKQALNGEQIESKKRIEMNRGIEHE